jgi:ribosomal protein S18 acetylase RimI-like enzyme
VTGLEFRHLAESTLEDMIEVLAKGRADDPHERRLTHGEAREQTVLDPDFDPKGTWLATLDGEVAGFGLALVEANRIKAGMDDAYVEVDVVPEHRGKGVEEALLESCLGYIRSRGVGKALCRSPSADDWKRALLADHSFEEAYRVYVLERRGCEMAEEHPLPEGFRLEHKALTECSDGDLSALVDAFNDAFQDHMNFAPERLERFMNFRDNGGDPRTLALALKGAEIAGFCLCDESATLNREKGVKTGWVDIIGVRPPHRRQGLARVLLADGINWIVGRGMDTVYLGVLAENEKALDLYKSQGFSKNRESIWFTRNLG